MSTQNYYIFMGKVWQFARFSDKITNKFADDNLVNFAVP